MIKAFRHIGSMVLLPLTAALAACTNDLPTVGGGQAGGGIGFGVAEVLPGVEASSRGKLIEDSRHFHSTMNVYAYTYAGSFDAATADVLMDRLTVRLTMPTPGDEHWEYRPIVRWPDKDMVKFFAYSPDIEDGSLSVSGTHVPTLTYTLPTEIDEQKDLMAAEPIERDMSLHQSTEVDFTFRHLLSAVRFRMSPGVSGSFVIKSITLKGLLNVGTFKLADGQMDGTAQGTPTDYTIDLTQSYPATGGFVWDAAKNTSVINSGEDAFLTIPQTCTNDAEVLIKVEQGGVLRELKRSLGGVKWEASNIYTYTITVAGSQLYLRPTVTPWVWDADANQREAFVADEHTQLSFTAYQLYDTDGEYTVSKWNDAYIAVAAGTVPPHTVTDEHGNESLVDSHAPARSALLTLTTTCSDGLKLVSDNAHARFAVYDNATGFDGTLQSEIVIPSGTDVKTSFCVVPDTEGLASLTREVKVSLVRQVTPPVKIPFASHEKLPGTSDHTSLKFYLMTPAEYDGGLNTLPYTPESE